MNPPMNETKSYAGWSGLIVIAWLASGCGPVRPAARLDMQSREVGGRIAAIKAAAEAEDRAKVPQLVDRLDDEDPAVRFAAILALERITGERLGYRYGDPPEARAEAVARWRRAMTEANGAAMPPNPPGPGQ